eukprot:tig00000551_g2028.t1
MAVRSLPVARVAVAQAPARLVRPAQLSTRRAHRPARLASRQSLFYSSAGPALLRPAAVFSTRSGKSTSAPRSELQAPSPAAPAEASTSEAIPDDFEFVKELKGIKEFLMKSNGMRVLVLSDHSAPVGLFMVTYEVGSRYEAQGHTGATHLLEHLMFKGSRNFNKEKGTSVWTVLQNIGAQMNATTWLDRTNYYAVVPVEHLEKVVAVEADRMRHAFLRDEDRRPEMSVVRQEYDRGDNDPLQVLDKHVWAAAYMAHGYHHSTIGWRSDIENVSTERLREFYDTYYHPNNACCTVVGDVTPAAALALVAKHFKEHGPAPHPIPRPYTEEEKQTGPRHVVVKRVGQSGIVAQAFKTPPALDKSTHAIQVLAQVLGSGKTSRLYRALVDTGIATRLFVSCPPLRENGLFRTYAFVAPGRTHEEVQAAIAAEQARLVAEGVTEAELARAKAAVRAATAFARDGAFSVAGGLNEAIAVGGWEFYAEYEDKIAAVTREEVQAAARLVFDEDIMTTGFFVPVAPAPPQPAPPAASSSSAARAAAANGAAPAAARAPKRAGAGKGIAEQVAVTEPVPGARVFAMRTPVEGVVTIAGSILGGTQFSSASNVMLANLAGKLLEGGTARRSKLEVGALLEDRGASLSLGDDGGYRVAFSGRCLREDLPLVLELLAEQLREPAFPEAELETLRARTLSDLERSRLAPGARASIDLLRRLYPENHPTHSASIEEMVEATRATTAADLRAFHAASYGLGPLHLVAVGDVDSEEVSELVARHFGGWRASPLAVRHPEGARALRAPRAASFISIPDRPSCETLLAVPVGVDRAHADYLPLMVGAYALGGNFSSRLVQRVRDERGLTYSIRAGLEAADDGADAYLRVAASFAPANVLPGREAIEEEVRRWAREGITEEELRARVETLQGGYKVGLASTRGLAGAILANADRGRAVSYLDEYAGLLAALPLERVNEAIRARVDPDALLTVAAGAIREDGTPL